VILGSSLSDATEVWVGEEPAAILATGPCLVTVEAPVHPGFPRVFAGGAPVPLRVVTPWGSAKAPEPSSTGSRRASGA